MGYYWILTKDRVQPHLKKRIVSQWRFPVRKHEVSNSEEHQRVILFCIFLKLFYLYVCRIKIIVLRL